MNKKKIIVCITILGTVLGIVLSGIAIYDRITDNDIFLEQTIDPDALKKYRDQGFDIKIEKGITNTPREEPNE